MAEIFRAAINHSFTSAEANEEFLKQLQIRDPLEGVNAGFQRLKEVHDQLNVFARRVVEYYKKSSRVL